MGIQGAAVASKLACRGFEILDIWILCGIHLWGLHANGTACNQHFLGFLLIYNIDELSNGLNCSASRLALAHQWLELEKDWAANWTP
ncbi:hypothetical protein QL285_078307 [Trifolium repens]|nr:hypothetical protein QL285_078307 [Trifolium repens]